MSEDDIGHSEMSFWSKASALAPQPFANPPFAKEPRAEKPSEMKLQSGS